MIRQGVSFWTGLFCLAGPWWTPASARVDSRTAPQYWSTEHDVVVGGEPGTPGALTRLSSVKVDAGGTRIVVRQTQRVTVWDTARPQRPVLEFGRRVDTPLVGGPRGAYPDSAGLWIQYDDGWGRFVYDGRFVTSTPNPPDRWLGSVAILRDGSFLARERYPPPSREFTWEKGHPEWEIAVAHVRLADGGWIADTLASYDASGRTFAVALGGSRTFSGQPFADHDIFYFDPRYDAAGFVERRGRGGGVRLVEIMPGNDSILDVRVPVRAVPLERERAEAAIAAKIREVKGMLRQFGGDTLSTNVVRTIVEEALYVPDQLPLVTAVVPTVSNEVWLRSSEKADSSVVWLVLDRNNVHAAPRLVLLPDWFRLRDATRDHVWGLRVDARRSGQVQGRRLVRP